MSAVQTFRGCVALCGPVADALVVKFGYAQDPNDHMIPHVTLLSKDEIHGLGDRKDELMMLLPTIDIGRIVPLGVVHHDAKDVRFIVLVWNAGQLVRKRYGLRPKQFHITLSKHDDHTIDKGYKSLSTPLDLAAFGLNDLDHIAVSFDLYDPAEPSVASEVALHMCMSHRSSEKGFVRLGDASFRRQLYKQAMLSYGKVLAFDNISNKLKAYCVRMMYKCSHHTEWGCIFAPGEWNQIEPSVRKVITTPWSSSVVDAIAAYDKPYVPTLCLESRTRLSLPPIESGSEPVVLPRFFRWIVPFRFAVMSTPRDANDIGILSSDYIGIRHVITLTEETPLPAQWFRRAKRPIVHTFIPIPNYHPPSIEQMDLILRQFENEDNLPILVHCGGGKGRAGTIAACYIAAFGFANPDFSRAQLRLSATDAIASLRSLRPGSIETQQQEKFVHTWCSAVWKRNAVLLPLPLEPPPCDLKIVGETDLKNADLLVLVGLPGSGKSHFTRSLVTRAARTTAWRHVSQDNSGSRALCETEIGRSNNTHAILDRCNTVADDRRYWLSLAATWSRFPVCVWFDYDAKICTSRAQNRTDHPTLPPGGRVHTAVASMQASMVVPRLEEGFKSILIIRSLAAADLLVRKLSPPLELFKFPRTPHLFDLGAATSDDIVSDVLPFAGADTEELDVIFTEKVDGANMGISLDAGRSFVVQNRSHYVTSDYHAQFSKLTSWLDTPHISQALHAILGADPYFPERYILFGEWMCATHSVAYTDLPDLFIAFDLYDRSLNRWATRDVLEQIVGARGIALVPIINRVTLRTLIFTREEFGNMVQRSSRFYDGRVEGIYIKMERGGTLVHRAKVVRDDFIAGNQHWSKGMLRWNGFASNIR